MDMYHKKAMNFFEYYSNLYQVSCSPARCSITLKWSQIATGHLKLKCSKGARRRLKISCSGSHGDKEELRKQKKALEALLRLSEKAVTGSAPTTSLCDRVRILEAGALRARCMYINQSSNGFRRGQERTGRGGSAACAQRPTSVEDTNRNAARLSGTVPHSRAALHLHVWRAAGQAKAAPVWAHAAPRRQCQPGQSSL